MPRCAPPLTLSILLLATIPVVAQPPAATPPTTPPPTSTEMRPTSPPSEILGDSLDTWIKRLDSKDAAVRELAVRTVPLFGAPAKKALPKLVDLTSDPDYAVRLAALFIVTANPIDDEKLQARIAQKVVDTCRHSQTAVRIAGAQAASRLGTAAAGAIDVLIGEYHIRNSLSYEARKAAAEALGQVAQRDPKNPESGPDRRAIIALINALSDSCLAVRIEAAQSLLFLGPPARPEDLEREKQILLQRIVAEPDKVLALWLRVCLIRLEPSLLTPKNIEPIAAALRSTEHRVRVNAADALALMGPAAKDRAGDLREGLRYANSDKPEDLEFLAKCLWAIGNMGKEASFLTQEVKPLVNHKDPTIKALAQEAVDRLEGKNPMMNK